VWGGGPEAELGFAAEFEGGEFTVAGVVPGEELPGGFVVLAGIEVAEKGGGCEATGTEIEYEVDEGVELALGEGDSNETSDGCFRNGDVGVENGLGLGQGDAVGVGLGGGEAMAVADGAESGDVRVDVIAETFGFFEQFEPCGAEAHDFFSKIEGPLAVFPVGKDKRTAYSSNLAVLAN